jgi:hypothetical protein
MRGKVFAPLHAVGFIPHRCKGCRLFVIFGEHQVMVQLIAKRVLISPLINKDFPVRHLLLARGNFASVNLNHQKCVRPDIVYIDAELSQPVDGSVKKGQPSCVSIVGSPWGLLPPHSP